MCMCCVQTSGSMGIRMLTRMLERVCSWDWLVYWHAQSKGCTRSQGPF